MRGDVKTGGGDIADMADDIDDDIAAPTGTGSGFVALVDVDIELRDSVPLEGTLGNGFTGLASLDIVIAALAVAMPPADDAGVFVARDETAAVDDDVVGAVRGETAPAAVVVGAVRGETAPATVVVGDVATTLAAARATTAAIAGACVVVADFVTVVKVVVVVVVVVVIVVGGVCTFGATVVGAVGSAVRDDARNVAAPSINGSTCVALSCSTSTSVHALHRKRRRPSLVTAMARRRRRRH